MEIELSDEDGNSETLDVTSIERGTFQTTEEHRQSGKVTHRAGDNYTLIRGIHPMGTEVLNGKNFVWLSGSMAPRGSDGKFPLVYIPEGHGITVTV